MRGLLDFFKRRWTDNPSTGIEYNNLETNRRVSRAVYRVDIARSNRTVRERNGRIDRIDVMRKVDKVNGQTDLITAMIQRVKGRM